MRWLAGTFDPSGRTDSPRLAGALTPHAASIVEQGPLRVAYSGVQTHARGPLCLLDGHLDNALALCAALAAPPSTSTEQLLAAGWLRWGPELLPRMRGDFALLIWDGERKEGLLARDQLGVRSLFLHELDGAWLFANEVRPLLALLPRRPPPDPVGLAHWVAGKGRAGPGTLYAGVRRLEPGSMLRLGADGAREQGYWRPRFREPLDAPAPELSRDVRAAIDRAVRRRLSPSGATGATGVLMSGGLDSAAVAASASVQAPGSVAAYCGVFPDHPAVDESGLIEGLRSSLELPGITAEVRAGGLLASALQSQSAWEMPLVGWGDFWALPLLREAASAGTGVVLGGDGGDELFGVRSYLIADRMRRGRPRAALDLVRGLPGAAYGPSRREVVEVAGSLAVLGALPYRLHEPLRRPLAARAYPRWLRPRTVRDLRESDAALAWKRLDGPRWWAHAVHVVTRGVEELGVFEELRRTAMLAGLEARHPLFDLDLVELVLGQPPRSTYDPRMNRPVLRASMAGLLPDAVRLCTRKALFDTLIVDSLMGADGPAVRALLTDPRAELGAFVDLRAVRRELLDGDPSRSRHPFLATQYVWRLITAECWLRMQAQPQGGAMLPPGCEPSRARVGLRPVSMRPRSPTAAP